MYELSGWLESQRDTATDEFALGAEKFAEMLRVTERVNLPTEELELVGRKDLERNHAALAEACAAFAPKMGLAACVDRMRANKPGGGTVEGARAQLDQLLQFVLEHKIVTIPSQEQALVAESPPFNRGNFAYISMPGPYESPAVKPTYYVGALRSAMPTFPASPTCCSCRYTKCGRATTCRDSIPTPTRRRSRRCGGTTPSVKAGRITPRR